MGEWVRPGPLRIEPGRRPDGVVIHVYAVPTQRLLAITTAKTEAEAAYAAGMTADQTLAAMRDDEDAVCLVAYDGDTGDRMDWHA